MTKPNIDRHFIDWMYPVYGSDEETPSTAVDEKSGDFHDFIEEKMREAYLEGYRKGFVDGVDKVLNDD